MKPGSVKTGQLVKIGDIVFKIVRLGKNVNGKSQQLVTVYYDKQGRKNWSSFDICLASPLTYDDRSRYEKWLRDVEKRTNK
jgi:hypothetical protein